MIGVGGAEPAQPFVAADPAVAVLIHPEELPAQPLGARQGGRELLLTKILRAVAQKVEALLRAAERLLGRDRPVGPPIARGEHLLRMSGRHGETCGNPDDHRDLNRNCQPHARPRALASVLQS